MKILYHIPFKRGLGADRWIFEGFRDAFLGLGHSISTFENHEKLEEKMTREASNLLITSQNDLLLLPKQTIALLKQYRRRGGKVFVRVGEDFKKTNAHIALLSERDGAMRILQATAKLS